MKVPVVALVAFAAALLCAPPSQGRAVRQGHRPQHVGRREVAPSIPARVFAPYVDSTLWPVFSLMDTYEATGHKYFTLAFIVGDGGCGPSWGGYYPLQDQHFMDQVNALREVGGDVIVSFGGAAGEEVGVTCTDQDELLAAYQAVVDMYGLQWIDFDIEGSALTDRESIDRRNQVIARLQAANPSLKVAFCLPAMPYGLTADGLYLLENAHSHGVRIDLVNVMSMNFGAYPASHPTPDGNMGKFAIDSVYNSHQQLLLRGIVVEMGSTPMIGQNDLGAERFYLEDAQELLAWANTQPYVTLLSQWSSNRDTGGCPNSPTAQNLCTGLAQSDFAFTNTFKAFTNGEVNNRPIVAIITPTDKSFGEVGGELTVEVEARDEDGSLVAVELLSGGESVGTLTQPPFSFTLTNLQKKVYTLQAAATDDDGARGKSSEVRVFVGIFCTENAWDSTQAYVKDTVVSHNDHEWRAKWWTSGAEPGTTGQYGVWEDLGECGGAPPQPEPTTEAPEKPDPTTDKPEPTTDKPEPTTDKPEPTTDKPEPTTDKPEPSTDKPEPSTDKPEPTTQAPKPKTDDQLKPPCPSTAWGASQSFVQGTIVTHNGHQWKAKWWTSGDEPGTTGPYGVWEDMGECVPPPPEPKPSCPSTLWGVSQAYVQGTILTHKGHQWRAKWWTSGAEPGTQPVWEDLGECVPPPPEPKPPCPSTPWDASQAYVKGTILTHNGHQWKAKWWTNGNVPGTTAVWEDLGECV